MARSLYLVAMLSSVLIADPLFGAGWRKCRRPTTWQACPRPIYFYCYPLPCKTDSPCYCLERKSFDYPGPMDLFECLTYPNGCGDPGSAFGELYYGPINADVVQTCGENDCGNCEVESRCGLETWGKGIPGHGMTLATRDQARQMLAAGNPAASQPRFYKIPMNTTPPIQYVFVAIVRIPPTTTPPILPERYIGVEMEPHAEPLSMATFGRPIPRSGAQFEIDYLHGGDSRKAFIWRKEDVAP